LCEPDPKLGSGQWECVSARPVQLQPVTRTIVEIRDRIDVRIHRLDRMADELTICLQQSNNWYQFVILPDTQKGLAFNAMLVPSASAWYCLMAYAMPTLVNFG
jgi:hypothetical protein